MNNQSTTTRHVRKVFSMKEMKRINAILGNKLLKYSTKIRKFVSILKELRVFGIIKSKSILLGLLWWCSS